MLVNVGDRVKLKSKNKYEVGDEISVRLINFKTGRRARKKTKCEVLECNSSTSAYIDGECYQLELEVLEDENEC